MQILLGSQSTIISIQKSHQSFQEILEYIQSQFTAVTVKKNTLYLPQSDTLLDQRIFVMKWIYKFYTQRHNKYEPDLKEALIKRAAKAVHFDFPISQETSMEVNVEFLTPTVCRLTPSREDMLFNKGFNRYFRAMKVSKKPLNGSIEVDVSSAVHKAGLKFFFSLNKLNTISLRFIYDNRSFDNFFSVKESCSQLSQACKVLNVKIDDSLKSIRKSYLQLAKKCHPDLLSDKSGVHIKKATKEFQNLLAAFDIIKEHKELF